MPTDDVETPDFFKQMQLNPKGHVIPNMHNAILCVRGMPSAAGQLRYNEFTFSIDWRGEQLTDISVTKLRADCERTFQVSFSADMMYQAVAVVAQESKYHPIRDYLASLTWDGTERLRNLFGSYFVTPERKTLYEEASRAFAIGAVARVYQPGAKVDTYPVLEGKQGIFKSSGIAALVPDVRWFSDTRIDLGNKDAYISLGGKWIYEVAELDSFKGWGSTRLKSFVSSSSDSYRPPYGRMLQTFPRQTVFIATTNESEYVSDPTGERRKWPIPVDAVDLDGLRRDRDSLWAEARVAYEAGAKWYLEGEVAEQMMEAAADKAEVDPLDERIAEDLQHKLMGMADSPGADLSYLSAGQVYEAIQSDSSRASGHERARISVSLRRLGFKSGGKRRVGNRVINVWLVPDYMRARAEAKRAAGGTLTPSPGQC